MPAGSRLRAKLPALQDVAWVFIIHYTNAAQRSQNAVKPSASAALQQPSLAIVAGFHAIQACFDVVKLLVHLALERVEQRLEKLHRVAVHTAIL
jgi:hypothetical protein